MKPLPLFCLQFLLVITTYSQEEGYMQTKGGVIYYRSFGKGVPMLIINGGPGMNSEGFTQLAIQLSKNNRTILFDQRGTGRSKFTVIDSSTITMQLMAEDIENLRKKLNIDKWIILGHSFGGMMASYYATLYPQQIEKMILSSSGGIDLELQSYVAGNLRSKLTGQQQDSLDFYNSKISRGDTSFKTRLQRAGVLAYAYVYNKANVPAISERLTQTNNRINGLVWNNLQKIHFDCAPKLSGLLIPVLIIQGKQDIVEEKTAKKAHRVLKNSKLILLDKCIHYGWLDKKEEYFSAINSFLHS
jgi:proline iminopeptidase